MSMNKDILDKIASGKHLVDLEILDDFGQVHILTDIREWGYRLDPDLPNALIVKFNDKSRPGYQHRVEFMVSKIVSISVHIYNPPLNGGCDHD